MDRETIYRKVIIHLLPNFETTGQNKIDLRNLITKTLTDLNMLTARKRISKVTSNQNPPPPKKSRNDAYNTVTPNTDITDNSTPDPSILTEIPTYDTNIDTDMDKKTEEQLSDTKKDGQVVDAKTDKPIDEGDIDMDDQSEGQTMEEGRDNTSDNTDGQTKKDQTTDEQKTEETPEKTQTDIQTNGQSIGGKKDISIGGDQSKTDQGVRTPRSDKGEPDPPRPTLNQLLLQTGPVLNDRGNGNDMGAVSTGTLKGDDRGNGNDMGAVSTGTLKGDDRGNGNDMGAVSTGTLKGDDRGNGNDMGSVSTGTLKGDDRGNGNNKGAVSTGTLDGNDRDNNNDNTGTHGQAFRESIDKALLSKIQQNFLQINDLKLKLIQQQEQIRTESKVTLDLTDRLDSMTSHTEEQGKDRAKLASRGKQTIEALNRLQLENSQLNTAINTITANINKLTGHLNSISDSNTISIKKFTDQYDTLIGDFKRQHHVLIDHKKQLSHLHDINTQLNQALTQQTTRVDDLDSKLKQYANFQSDSGQTKRQNTDITRTDLQTTDKKVTYGVLTLKNGLEKKTLKALVNNIKDNTIDLSKIEPFLLNLLNILQNIQTHLRTIHDNPNNLIPLDTFNGCPIFTPTTILTAPLKQVQGVAYINKGLKTFFKHKNAWIYKPMWFCSIFCLRLNRAAFVGLDFPMTKVCTNFENSPTNENIGFCVNQPADFSSIPCLTDTTNTCRYSVSIIQDPLQKLVEEMTYNCLEGICQILSADGQKIGNFLLDKDLFDKHYKGLKSFLHIFGNIENGSQMEFYTMVISAGILSIQGLLFIYLIFDIIQSNLCPSQSAREERKRLKQLRREEEREEMTTIHFNPEEQVHMISPLPSHSSSSRNPSPSTSTKVKQKRSSTKSTR
jgi:hypothetical protein